MSSRAERSQERRVRRMAERYGYRLQKSRRRNPDADDFGLYAVIDVETGGTVNASGPTSPHTLTLDEAEVLLE